MDQNSLKTPQVQLELLMFPSDEMMGTQKSHNCRCYSQGRSYSIQQHLSVGQSYWPGIQHPRLLAQYQLGEGISPSQMLMFGSR